MHVVLVHVHVKLESVESFKKATIENARKSLKEPGIARFDVIQQDGDVTRFILIEAYRTPDDALKHKDAAHYQVWRDAVADMMAEPRRSLKYVNIFPDDTSW
jgi:(4S)-4-hydroxy-5-phosphonooxypentane-2,3-dione isomerase